MQYASLFMINMQMNLIFFSRKSQAVNVFDGLKMKTYMMLTWPTQSNDFHSFTFNIAFLTYLITRFKTRISAKIYLLLAGFSSLSFLSFMIKNLRANSCVWLLTLLIVVVGIS